MGQTDSNRAGLDANGTVENKGDVYPIGLCQSMVKMEVAWWFRKN